MLTDYDVAAICQAARDGATVKQINARLGHPVQTIYNVLRRAGIPPPRAIMADAEAQVDRTYGSLTVLAVSGVKAYRHGAYTQLRPVYHVRCACGKEYDTSSYPYDWTACPACVRASNRIPAADVVGKTYKNLTVLGVVGDWVGLTRSRLSVRCGLCGQETVILGQYLGKTDACRCSSRDVWRKAVAASTPYCVSGTSVLAIDGRRKINSNSTTGHTGVCKTKDGQYRAYINFRRHQYHLGVYNSLDDAVAARRQAEEEIYGDFLAWFAVAYPDEWARLQAKNISNS